jgi:SsrA-binding protein
MEKRKNITVNKKAFHDYEITEKYETGIVLVGTEVKSIRQGKVSLRESYVEIRFREPFLINSNVSQYSNASCNNHEPRRKRKLLLNKREIIKLERKVKIKGVSIIPLRMYFNKKGFVKIEIGVAKGKRLYEKKQAIKERDIKREMERDLKNY